MSTVDLDSANKITIEALVYGYLRLHILPLCSVNEVPTKVFNTLLSTIICNDIKQCKVLSTCLDILKQYDQWVNIDKKSKQTFVCNITINTNDIDQDDDTKTNDQYSSSELLQQHFDHISNLHGLTYKDYDDLHKHCSNIIYNANLNISSVSILNECSAMDCLILNEEQRNELKKLFSASSSSVSNDLTLDNATNTMKLTDYITEPDPSVNSPDSGVGSEADDTFPTTADFMGGSGTINTINSQVTSLLTPTWKKSRQSLSARSKWQKHVSAVSSTEVSVLVSQLSMLSMLPTVSDDLSDEDTMDDQKVAKRKDTPLKLDKGAVPLHGVDIILPTPYSPGVDIDPDQEMDPEPNMSISVKSYRFLFDNINAKKRESVAFREVAQMSVNPFDLLPEDSVMTDEDYDEPSITDYKNGDKKNKKKRVKVKKKEKKYEYEFRTKLNEKLVEVDIMGEGALDMISFSTAVTSIVKDYTYDPMEISTTIFDDDGLQKDDMDAAKIGDIISFVIASEDEEVINLRRLLCEGLGVEYNEDEIEDEKDGDGGDTEFAELELKEREKNDEPYKPVYQITSGIQRFGNNKKEKDKDKSKSKDKVKSKEKENVKEVSFEDDGSLAKLEQVTSITITKTIDDDNLSEILDKMHVYLFHAVHNVKQIPL